MLDSLLTTTQDYFAFYFIIGAVFAILILEWENYCRPEGPYKTAVILASIVGLIWPLFAAVVLFVWLLFFAMKLIVDPMMVAMIMVMDKISKTLRKRRK